MIKPILRSWCMATALTGIAAAQDTIIAERPGFSSSPQALPGALYQIETGVEHGFFGDATSMPFFLLRHGLGASLEVQLGWSGVTLLDGDTEVSGGSLSLKYQVAEGEGLRPAIGIIGTANIPSGDEASSQVDPQFGLLWSNSLSGGFSLFGTATAGMPSEDEDRFFELTNAVGLGYAVTDRFGLFIEHFVADQEDVPEETQVVDAGLTFLPTPNVQLDITGGISVGEADAGSFLGGGVAFRF